MRVVGIYGQGNEWTHDHNITLSENGKITRYAQLERLTRKKYDNRIPEFVADLDSDFGISHPDTQLAIVNTFALHDDFFKVASNAVSDSEGRFVFEELGTNTLLPQIVHGTVFGKKRTATIVPHEIAHVFSCIPFYGSFKDNSLLVHIDGAASLSNSSVWLYKSGQLKLLHYGSELYQTVHSYSYNDLVLHILGIPKDRYLSMPGKLMGYASFGNYNADILQWIKANSLFESFKSYPLQSVMSSAKKKFGSDISLSIHSQFAKDIAFAFQRNFEESLFEYILQFKKETSAEYLYYSGGAALNIKFNSKLANSGLFKEIYIPPPAGDSGLSLGAVSYLNWKQREEIRTSSPYLNNFHLDPWEFDPEFSIDEVCQLLDSGAVIGVCTGAGEAGPRALGHRSILAIPEEKMFKKVSMELKGREWYRPLAPIVLERNTFKIFENSKVSSFAKYMLQEFTVKEEYRRKIPAVVHVDGTSRPQIVDSEDPELSLITAILQKMDDEYGYPCLINTSFNSADEPIIHSKDDAQKSAKKMGLDALILDNKLYRSGEW